jgi:acyl dehydratase
MTIYQAGGPYFDDLHVGLVFDSAPAYTLTDGRQAAHQAIVGDRLRLPLDDVLATKVAGGPLAHPAFVWDVAIGQSTLATQHVKANLFYRNLIFRRWPLIGDTLGTTTTVGGLRENRRKEGRPPTGLAALRMVTTDQQGRTVLDFYRCAMLPLRGDSTGHSDALDQIGLGGSADPLACLDGLDLAALPQTGGLPAEGDEIRVVGGDVVSSAPELARLSLNVAAVHHDAAAAAGTRLVYGGHTIGIALSQASRAIPGLVGVLGWHGCDHVGPVHEGDTLRSVVTIERLQPGQANSFLADLRSRVESDQSGAVLDWRFSALLR